MLIITKDWMPLCYPYLYPVHILDLFLCHFLVVYFLIVEIGTRVNARQNLPRGRPLRRTGFFVRQFFMGTPASSI